MISYIYKLVYIYSTEHRGRDFQPHLKSVPYDIYFFLPVDRFYCSKFLLLFTLTVCLFTATTHNLQHQTDGYVLNFNASTKVLIAYECSSFYSFL